MTEFEESATKTKFAIETKEGFWNRNTQTYGPIEQSSTFNWLEQEDYLSEAMESIADKQGDWFKVVVVTPFND